MNTTLVRAVIIPGVLCGMAMMEGSFGAAWRQYRGEQHDGSSTEKILKAWPKGGPTRVWKAPTPAGFSSFVVAGGRAFTQVARQVEGVNREVCLALNADTGAELWATPVGMTRYGNDGGNSGTNDNKGGDGPRSTPSIDGDRVYVLSSDLVLFALEAGSGKAVWARDLTKDHKAPNITWKNAASPLVHGDLIYICAGGPGEALLAINKRDGQTAWKGEDDKMTHATPVAATILGVPQVIFFTQKGLVSVVPGTGKVLWRYAFDYRVSTAASPVVGGDIVYCAAGYGVGSAAVKISKSGDKFEATEIWRKRGDKPVANHWSTPVYHNGYLYGMFSFKEYGSGPLKCVELATGAVVWEKEGFGAGNVIKVDNHILALGDAGQLALVEASPKAYTEVARAEVLDGKCWSTPVFSDGRVYARSTKEGVCLDLSLKTAGGKR